MEIKLTVLTVTEYNLIGTKDPSGSYDRKTRENLYWIIEKLRTSTLPLSKLESRLLGKFRDAAFGALEEKDKKVKFEVARYRLSSKVKHTLKLVASGVGILIVSGFTVYQFFLDSSSRQKIDVAWYQGLNPPYLIPDTRPHQFFVGTSYPRKIDTP